jgi:hypothetical protein
VLATVHLIVGLVVVGSNAAAAALLWADAQRAAPPGERAGRLLALARGSLALQILLGLVLAAGGAVGAAAHYLAAFAAAGVAWAGFARQRSGPAPARDAAVACGVTALLALAALILGWR